MTDSTKIKLFAKQERIYPRGTSGKFRKIKWLLMAFTLSIYYLAPWLRWDRGGNAPDQAILIDIPNSRAYFFFIEIWPQEIYYITGILILAALALFFITSLYGRVWCGYLCPQTVWTDLFVWVERRIQGDRNSRIKLDKQPFTFNKFYKKIVTHIIWIIISLATAGAWVFYFNDAPTLAEQILDMNVPTSVLGWMAALTFTTYLMAGFAREQVCIYMCPYAKFQSAMFDEDSLIIGYDEKRGEPRQKYKAGDNLTNKGHCVDCTLCVQVCPMGIDIRDGLQMECIACGLCIDACNSVMDKLKLPQDLIRYSTLNEQNDKVSSVTKKNKLLRPRALMYLTVLIISSSIILYSLLTRSPVELYVLHDRNPLFVKLSNGEIRNGYNVKILNKTFNNQSYKLKVTGLEKVTIKAQGAGEINSNNLLVLADSVGHFRIFISAEENISPRKEIIFSIENNSSDIKSDYKSIFISKEKL